MSKIEWTEQTWNPVTGCTKISDGCKNCYAEKMAFRLKAMGLDKYKNGFNVALHPDVLNDPFYWKKQKMVFVNSMSDIFHKDIPFEFIQDIFKVMNKTNHIYQLLTKRSHLLLKHSANLNWTNNIWMGVTVESSKYLNRIDDLRKSQAKVKFLSLEPLLSELNDLDLTGIDWVIVGGESGQNSRSMNEDWVIDIYQKCKDFNVPFFFKQWGGTNKKKNGRTLNDNIYSEMPIIAKELVF